MIDQLSMQSPPAAEGPISATDTGQELFRLEQCERGVANWKRWGPYLTERQWGTVREDYSREGAAWRYSSHDDARSKAYRWGEEGIAGISDDQQVLCFALALWNGRDPIIKERLFGLTGEEGNHGEDVKELYYYLDSSPTHSYMKMLYKYPQCEFPYARLVEENRRRGRGEPEFELIETGVFDEDRYFDVFVEYVKAGPEDILVRISAHNRGPEPAVLHFLPQIWFRNTWSWGRNGAGKPMLSEMGPGSLVADSSAIGRRYLYWADPAEPVFCENETNFRRLYGVNMSNGYYKDGISNFIVHRDRAAVNTSAMGTKAAIHRECRIPALGRSTFRLRLSDRALSESFKYFDEMVAQRIAETDEFYSRIQQGMSDPDERMVQRQAFAGMLWSKQFYYYDVRQWIEGDPGQPGPPRERKRGRNNTWFHLSNADVVSMPDKWEYPWYAAWDLAFHCIPLALVDPEFAKQQLLLLTREWYMHPNGQLPAYEWAFGDVNPPVHAWATWRVYKIDQKLRGGRGDLAFLESMLHKLLLNFTWWVNRKDEEGHNIFQGGFLGLDNIGVFDRSSSLPTGGHIEQADGTSWMGMYCLNLMRISLELAMTNPVYQDIAAKFFEHFLYIAGAMTNIGSEGISLWDSEDEFFYDVLHTPDDRHVPLKVRSMVGLIPLFAVETLEPMLLDTVPQFKARVDNFLRKRPDLGGLVSRWQEPGRGERRLLSLLRGHRMKALLKRVLNENEFFSPYGIRALSRVHQDNPYVFRVDGMDLAVRYQPGESDSGLFGGNSNWRGPIWFPVNYLIIESMQKFHHYYGDDFKIECPTGSGNFMTIDQAATEIGRRLIRIFRKDETGRRPVFGHYAKLQDDPNFRDYLLFYEYFHGDNGRGVGASHQTGWTGLIAKLLQPRRSKRPPDGEHY